MMPRPRSVTFLAWLVFSIAVFNALAVVGGAGRYAYLSRLPLSTPPLYLLISGAIWALVFSGLAAGLWRLKAWARPGTLIGFSLYLMQDWVNRLWLSRADYAWVSLPFALGTSLLGLALVWGILWRQKVRQSFK